MHQRTARTTAWPTTSTRPRRRPRRRPGRRGSGSVRYPHRPHSPYETRWRVLRARQGPAAETNQNLCTPFRESARAYWLTAGPRPTVTAPHPWSSEPPSRSDARAHHKAMIAHGADFACVRARSNCRLSNSDNKRLCRDRPCNFPRTQGTETGVKCAWLR